MNLTDPGPFKTASLIMTSKKKLGLAAVMSALVLFVWFLVLPMFRFAEAKKKFPLGMTLEDVQKIATPPVEVRPDGPLALDGPVSPDGELSEQVKLTYPFYRLRAKNDGVLLQFNFYRKLIVIIPADSPIDMVMWKWSRK